MRKNRWITTPSPLREDFLERRGPHEPSDGQCPWHRALLPDWLLPVPRQSIPWGLSAIPFLRLAFSGGRHMNMKRIAISLALGLFFVCFSAAADPPQTRIVCKSGCTYSEPADAVDSITDSASDKPYTVTVYPGTYTKPITMKSYVGIVGYDPASTIILGTDNSSSVAITLPAGV